MKEGILELEWSDVRAAQSALLSSQLSFHECARIYNPSPERDETNPRIDSTDVVLAGDLVSPSSVENDTLGYTGPDCRIVNKWSAEYRALWRRVLFRQEGCLRCSENRNCHNHMQV